MNGGFAVAADGVSSVIAKAAMALASEGVSENANLLNHLPYVRQPFGQRSLEKKMVYTVCDNAEPLGQIVARPHLVRRHHAGHLAVSIGGLNDGIDCKQIIRMLELAGNAHEICQVE